MLSPQVHQEHSKLHRTLIAPPNRGSPFGQKSQELTLNVRGSVLHNTDSTKLGKYSRGGRPKCSCSKDKNTQPSHRSILKDATHSNVDKVKSHVPRRKIVNIAISGAFCRICNLECGSLGLLKEHLQKKELTCRVCLKKFNSHKALENHYFTHKKYSCLDCKEIFFDKKQLFMHRTALNHYSYQQECNMCGMKVLSHDSVPQPKTPFHLNGVAYFKCVVCAKEFALASSLKCHLQSYHTVYERIKCTVCKKKLSGPEKLITHMKISHSGSEKDLRPACAICGKKFSSNDDLKKHVDTHKCSICGVSIKGKTALKNHMNFSHPARAKCLFKHCNLEFDNVLALSRHSKKVHSNASAPLLETESRCEVCGKTFKTSLTMNGLCSDEKPVKCNICVVKFKHHFMMRSLKSY
ncbi:hypothetical protein J6590_066910 [Homalodisca vitripennis]|nr:hypothetical protein J6590_066910 [Homalodisca vitripennis]